MTAAREPELIGVVLAGGSSRRMGRDKGAIAYHGRTQAAHCLDLLAAFSRDVLLSARDAQTDLPPYDQQSVLVDAKGIEGPAAGLLAAWQRFPDAALLVLAVDMPFVDMSVLTHLTEHRDATRPATAYRHPDGTIEPLCAIYEPAAAAGLREAAARDPAPSLRRYLESTAIAVLDPPDPAKLTGANSPEAMRAALAALARS